MTSGILKIVGLMLVVVSVLVLLAGLAAAGYGYVDENNNQEALLPDPERSSVNEDLMMYGLVGAGGGLVVLVVGIVVAVAGGSVSRRRAEALAPEASTRPSGRGVWVAGAAVALAVVLALLVTGYTGNGDGPGLASLAGDSRTELLDEAVYDGQVRNAYSTPTGSGTTDASQSTRTFPAPTGTTRVEMELTWTPQDRGTGNLRLILEAQDGDSWRELDRAAGQGPLTMTIQAPDLDGVTLRYRVFANDDASLALEQDFQVTVRLYGTS